MRSARNGIDSQDIAKLAREYDLYRVRLPRGRKPTYTEAHEICGDCIVVSNVPARNRDALLIGYETPDTDGDLTCLRGRRAKHVCAIVGGKLRDTFDSRIYHFWDGTPATGGLAYRERKAQSVWINPLEAMLRYGIPLPRAPALSWPRWPPACHRGSRSMPRGGTIGRAIPSYFPPACRTGVAFRRKVEKWLLTIC